MQAGPRRIRLEPVCLALIAAALGAATASAQEAELVVRVFDEATGESEPGLDAGRFAVRDGTTPLRILAVSEPDTPIDLLVAVDSSMVGDIVRPLAEEVIRAAAEDEQVALVGIADTATLLQDFTADKQLLEQALNRTEYAGLPRLYDGVFASIDSGFELSSQRKAVILLSAGAIARGRTTEAEVVRLARAKGVSVITVFMRNDARRQLRRLALRTGGAAFAAKRLQLQPRQLARRVLEAVRASYTLTVSGVYTFGDDIVATIESAGGKQKLTAAVLPVD